MANTIGSNYSMYQKTLGQVGSKKDAGKKKPAEGEKKPDTDFGADFGVQLSDAGLAALAAQRKQEAEKEDHKETSLISEDKLSDKAKDFLAKLREKYGDKYDFFAVSSVDDPRATHLTGSKAYSVLLTNDEIEKMANDEEYAEEVMKKVESAVDMTKRIEEKGELGEGVQFKHISISFDGDGNMKLFVELEKMSDQQRERMEKMKEKRAEEKEKAEKAKDKDDGKDDPGVKRVRLEAASEEELLEKIAGINWDEIRALGEKEEE